MIRRSRFISLGLAWVSLTVGIAKDRHTEKSPALWTEPKDISTRDLLWGQGGKERAPGEGPFVFVEEDKDGNSAKFVVKDNQDTKWKVKLGAEAKPETVVTRFVWAVGYSTDEDYFIPLQQIENMPPKLSRGDEFVSDGKVRDTRWERLDHKKLRSWKWSENPFSDTRELNGLRVLMALFNNYDMKDSQNSVYEYPENEQFIVSDLGATLGPTGSNWPLATARGDAHTYKDSDFIKKATPEYVDFAAPSWPMMFKVIPMPPLPYSILTAPFRLLGLPSAPNVTGERWIGKRIPRQDVVWIARLLQQLSPNQIRDAFRAASYSAEDVETFSGSIEMRVAILGRL